MRKNIFKLTALCIICALFFTVKSCKTPEFNPNNIEEEQFQELLTRSDGIVWDYPVKPYMEQWGQFKTMDDMYRACQIPEGILKNLDTESLVELCLNFPAPPLFIIFNTPQQAFMQYYSNFNGIRELFQRKDAGQYLLEKYSSMSLDEFNPIWELHEQGRFVSHYKFIEAILSQPQIMESLGSDGRKALLKEAIKKINEKLFKNDLFGGFSLEINMWVILRVLYSENESLLQWVNQQNLQETLATGMFINIDADRLYQLAKSMTYEGE